MVKVHYCHEIRLWTPSRTGCGLELRTSQTERGKATSRYGRPMLISLREREVTCARCLLVFG